MIYLDSKYEINVGQFVIEEPIAKVYWIMAITGELKTVQAGYLENHDADILFLL